MTTGLKTLGAVLAFALAGPVQAATLDLVNATNDGTTLVAAGATIVAGLGTTLSVGDFIANAVCPLGGAGCNGTMVLVFDQDVRNVTFRYGLGNPGDTATLTVFNGAGGIIGGTTVFLTSGIATEDLSFFGTLRSIAFDNSAATGSGYAYGDISYDLAAIPLPATLPLMAAAAAGLLALRRRRAA